MKRNQTRWLALTFAFSSHRACFLFRQFSSINSMTSSQSQTANSSLFTPKLTNAGLKLCIPQSKLLQKYYAWLWGSLTGQISHSVTPLFPRISSCVFLRVHRIFHRQVEQLGECGWSLCSWDWDGGRADEAAFGIFLAFFSNTWKINMEAADVWIIAHSSLTSLPASSSQLQSREARPQTIAIASI